MGSTSNLCHELKSKYSLLSCESITKKDGSDYILIRSSFPTLSGYLPHLNVVVESGVVKLLSYHGRILKEETFAGGIILEQLNEGKLFFCIGIGSLRGEGLEDSALKEVFSEPSTDGDIVYRSRSCSFFLEDTPGICYNCQMFLESLHKVHEGEENNDWTLLNNKEEDDDDDFVDEDTYDNIDDDWEEAAGEEECPKCGKVYKESCIDKHLKHCRKKVKQKNSAAPQEFPISCKICLQKFSRKCSYNRHYSQHTSVMDLVESIDCPICKKCLDNRKCLNDHIHESHDSSKGCCVICFEMMPNENLEKHLEKRHSNILMKHLCPECGKKFKFPFELKYHIARHHDLGGDKFVVCEQCGKGVPHKRALTKHIRRSHNKSNVFPCDQCNKVFYEKCRLQKHLQIHSGVKPFKCSMCNHCCVRKDNVRIHIRRVHKKEPVPSDVIFIPSIEKDCSLT